MLKRSKIFIIRLEENIIVIQLDKSVNLNPNKVLKIKLIKMRNIFSMFGLKTNLINFICFVLQKINSKKVHKFFSVMVDFLINYY